MFAGPETPSNYSGVPTLEPMHLLPKQREGNPIFFVTVRSASRGAFLTSPDAVGILTAAWKGAPVASGWVVGRYVIMPDHVHFFTQPRRDGRTLGEFVDDWKKLTARLLTNVARIPPPVWQPEFFDQVLNSAGSYAEKWEYVCANPVRSGHAPSARRPGWPPGSSPRCGASRFRAGAARPARLVPGDSGVPRRRRLVRGPRPVPALAEVAGPGLGPGESARQRQWTGAGCDPGAA